MNNDLRYENAARCNMVLCKVQSLKGNDPQEIENVVWEENRFVSVYNFLSQ